MPTMSAMHPAPMVVIVAVGHGNVVPHVVLMRSLDTDLAGGSTRQWGDPVASGGVSGREAGSGLPRKDARSLQ